MKSCLSASPPKSCVIDNTSPSRGVRAEYLSLIRTSFPGVRVRCFYFTAPIQLAMHNSVYRALCEPVDKGNGKVREVLPMVAFLSFRTNLEIPTVDEGESAALDHRLLSLPHFGSSQVDDSNVRRALPQASTR